MITIDNSNVNIEFGENGLAKVSLTNAKNTLIIQALNKNNLPIGSSAKPEDIKPLPKIEMEFSDVESIDVLIAKLEAIKFYMQYSFDVYAMAC